MSQDHVHSEPAMNKQKLWGGRFSGATDPLMDKFNASLPFDKILYSADITASQVFFFLLLSFFLIILLLLLLHSSFFSFHFFFLRPPRTNKHFFCFSCPQAYAEALQHQKILTEAELKSIVDGLELVRKEVCGIVEGFGVMQSSDL